MRNVHCEPAIKNGRTCKVISGGLLKRSKNIRLILITGFSAGALAGCAPSGPPPVTTSNVYTNDYYVVGVGYYHAPFRSWFPYPYNHFDQQKNQYFFGGQWAASPNESITNISSPTEVAAQYAETARTDVTRGGFGGSHGGFFSS
jgi:hypothetical protein